MGWYMEAMSQREKRRHGLCRTGERPGELQDVASVVWPQSAASADRRKGTRREARTSPGCQGALG
jgi:hypothetical protein